MTVHPWTAINEGKDVDDNTYWCDMPICDFEAVGYVIAPDGVKFCLCATCRDAFRYGVQAASGNSEFYDLDEEPEEDQNEEFERLRRTVEVPEEPDEDSPQWVPVTPANFKVGAVVRNLHGGYYTDNATNVGDCWLPELTKGTVVGFHHGTENPSLLLADVDFTIGGHRGVWIYDLDDVSNMAELEVYNAAGY